MEIRAQAAQFFATVEKVAAATQAMADETVIATDGMGSKVTARTEKMGASVSAATEAMAAKASAQTEGMAARVVAEIDSMSTGGTAGAEGMAAKVTASIEEMAAAVYHGMTEMTAQTSAAMKEQSASVVRAQEANTVAVTKAADVIAAADSRVVKAEEEKAAATKVAGLQMQSTFEKTALSGVASMGTMTGAFAGAALKQAEAAKGAEANLMGVANGITKVAAVAGIAIGVIGLDMAAHFQKSTTLLVTAGGEAKANLGFVRDGILGVAKDTGTSTEQLSEGMYVMEKAGYRGASGLAALRASAEGAKAENVDLATMTQATTDILLDYGYKMDNAKDATASSVSVVNQLVAASGAAKTTMQDFAASMAAVVPIASSAHISFAEVGGALATMTQHGQTAQQSSQNLANLIQSLIKPNLQAAASMQQMGIDTTDLAKNLGNTGLSGALKTIHDQVVSHMGPDGLVLQDTMAKNKNATRDLKAEMAAMPPELAKLSQGLLDGTTSQKEYGKATKDLGGVAGASGNQFMALYKSSQGYNTALKQGAPLMMTYQAEMTKVLGNVTAARAATMLLMNNSDDLYRSIALVTDAAKQSGDHISTWAETQSQLSVQLDQAKQRSETLAIEIGSKLIPAANGALSGFADLFHGFEQGNPVLLGIAGVLGGVMVVSLAAYTIKMIEAGVATVDKMITMGAEAIAMGGKFVAGFLTSEIAVGQFSSKAEIAGAKVRGMAPALGAVGVVAGVVGIAFMGLNEAQKAWGTNDTAPKADKIQKALAALGTTADTTGKVQMDNLFKQFDSGALKAAPKNVDDLDSAIKAVTHESFDDTMNKVGDSISRAFGAGTTSGIGQVEDRLKGVGDSLGKMVSGGQIDTAAISFNKLATSYEQNGKSAQDALDTMPGYKTALVDLAAQTGQTLAPQELLELAMGKVPKSMQTAATATTTYTDAAGNVRPMNDQMKKSFDDAGVAIDGQITDLGKLYDAMVKTGLANLSARDAEFRFGDAARTATEKADALKTKLGGDLSSALDGTGADFNKTTAAGKEAEDQFSNVAQSGLQTASVLAHDVTKGAGDVSKSLGDTVTAMEKTATGFGLGKDAAEALTRKVLNIPPGVDIKSWLDDTAAKQVAGLKKDLDGQDGRTVNVAIKINPIGEQRFIDAALGIPLPPASIAINPDANKATGGLLSHIPGRAGGGIVGFARGGSPLLDVGPGGLLHGPGSGTSDSIHAAVSNGEFVIREAMVRRYGLGLFNSLNDGTFGATQSHASVSALAPVNTPQLAYAGGGGQRVTNNHKTVHNSVTIHADGVDPRRLSAELGNQLQLMS